MAGGGRKGAKTVGIARLPVTALRERNREILQLARQGTPGNKIAPCFGISRERVRQILARLGHPGLLAARVAAEIKRRADQITAGVRCPLCGTSKRADGFRLCATCRKKAVRAVARWRKSHPDYHAAMQRKYREQRRAMRRARWTR